MSFSDVQSSVDTSFSGRSMNLEDIPNSLRDKTILVTGATGFLAKVLVEKILRTQPYVKKLYLLIRAQDSSEAKQRLMKEIFETDLFRVPVGKWEGGASSPNIENGVVVAVAGDVSEYNLGIMDNELRSNMWNELDIIISSAATTRFDERYDFALRINTFGVKNITDFAKRCVKLQMLLHVSTAYVRCNNTTRFAQEEPFSMGETLVQQGSSNVVLDINKEKQVVEEAILELKNNGISLKQQVIALRELGMKRASMHGWVNTYSFTKSMGEMILMNSHDAIPLVIVRPTIITSTYKEPFPGWTEGFKTIDGIAISYGRGKLKCLVGDPNTVVDLIPVDMVVNAMLVAIAVNAKEPYSSIVYNVGSSMRNLFRSGDLLSFVYRYFKKYPLITENGKPIVVPDALTLFPSVECLSKHMKLHYIIPLIKVLGVVSWTCLPCLKGLHSDLHRQISLAMRFSKLYEPYLISQTIFDDRNTENLRRSYKKKEGESDIFEFDPTCIDWEDYILRIHFPGAIKYVAEAK